MFEPKSKKSRDQLEFPTEKVEAKMQNRMPSCCDILCDHYHLELVIFALAAARTEQLIYAGFSDAVAIGKAEYEKEQRIKELEAGNEVRAILGVLTPNSEDGSYRQGSRLCVPTVFK